nr:glycosyltransferase family 2 protein [Lachnospiraceae bacterium]
MDSRQLISFVVPCFNEEEALPIYYRTMEELIKNEHIIGDLDYEYWFIDDGSKDATIDMIKELRAKDEKVHYVSFSRNFGKEAALFAGLQNATGDYVVTMDVDLQDSPELLKEMYEAVVTEDYDCAAARRVTREGEKLIRSFLSDSFYKVINKMAEIEIASGARDYRFMKRVMVDAIVAMGEYNRFSKGIFSWVGFKTKWIEYRNVERSAGSTKWSIWKLFSYALDGIVAFSTKLLNLASGLGLGCCFLAFVGLIFVFVRALLYGDPVAGWPSMMCIIIFIGGLQLLCIGILSMYLSKTYLETKHRPIYIAREKE